jgi:UDP-N-acetylglucosamine--N-acetylmuramyl-(pentapeptide) pyrophosphoryl-undecaprenol N-acetylglucosamine transferase
VQIALATGGTAGHVTPALAVADAIGRRWPDAGVRFLGSASGFEAQLVAARGHAFTSLPAAPWYGVGPIGRVRAGERLVAGVRTARAALAADGTDVVIGFGGYATAGAALAARSLRIPVVLHEANARPGLSNRLLGRIASAICVAWPEAVDAFSHTAHIHLTGMPIRADIAALAGIDHPPPVPGRLRLLVCGGSLGSAFLNRCVPDLATALRDGGIAVEVWHQAGARPLDELRAAYDASGVAARVAAHVDDMAAAYRWADVAIACAGAATLAEIAAAGLPAVLVPLATASDDHQSDNAAAFARASGVAWVRERDWNTAALAGTLGTLARDPSTWLTQSLRVRAAARPDAAAAVVAALGQLLCP